MTTSVLLKLGEFTFSVSTAAFQTLRRSHQYQWQSQARLGGGPALQYTGIGETSIELAGVIYPGVVGGVDQMRLIRSVAAKGAPLLLVAGTGDILGYWAVRGVQETGSHFFSDGVARKQDFSISLVFYGDRYEGARGG